MNRKEFLKTCSYTCLGLVGFSALMESCTGVKHINAAAENNQLKVARSEFIEVKKDKTKTRRHIIVRSSSLNFPVVLYRFSDTDYSALLLQCSHQGMELNVNGDLLTCSAHGSEFTNKGAVTQGPADQSLKKYKVTNDSHNIYIHLS
ncbi:MAG: Rieske (2Fe-2S) protein [Bacteroidota bacterium]